VRRLIKKIRNAAINIIKKSFVFFGPLSNWLCLRFAPKELAEFNVWCKRPVEQHVVLDTDTYNRLQTKPVSHHKWIMEELEKDQHVQLSVSWAPEISKMVSSCAAQFFTLDYSNKDKLDLKDRNIRNLHINKCKHVRLTNCQINELTIQKINGEIEIHNCWIEKFMINDLEAVATYIERGAVLFFKTETTEKGFGGDFVLKNVYIPRKSIGKPIFIQNIRNFRQRLEKSSNVLAASRVHSVELALERKNEENWVNKVINYIYEVGADYGNSTVRPLLWFVFFIATSTIVAATTDTITFGVSIAELKGWEGNLVGDHFFQKLLRGWVFAWKSVLNPLGIFSYKNTLVPKSFEYAGLFAVLGTFAIISFAFFLIALRRRFKMHIN
jgi:hypothetical protein